MDIIKMILDIIVIILDVVVISMILKKWKDEKQDADQFSRICTAARERCCKSAEKVHQRRI